MDFVAIIGVVLAFAAVIGGNFLEGGHLGSLLNTPAALIVLGGTLGAVVFQTPGSVLKEAVGRLRWMFLPPRPDYDSCIQKIVRWSKLARKEGFLGLENLMSAEHDPFTHKALELLVDGSEPHSIRHALEIEAASRARADIETTRVFKSLGGYAPTVGILGAVLGLIHVMGNLANPEQLGSGIATAFVATIYGVGIANLFFLPLADKIQSISNGFAVLRDLLVEGVVGIAEGENPRTIELRLRGFATTES